VADTRPKKVLTGQVFGDDVHLKMVAKALDLSPELAKELREDSSLKLSHTEVVVKFDGDDRIIGNRSVKIVEQDYMAVVVEASVSEQSIASRARAYHLYALATLFVAFPFLNSLAKSQHKARRPVLAVAAVMFILSVGMACYKLYKRKKGMRTTKLVYAPHIATSVLCEYQRRTPADVIASSVHRKMMRMAAFPLSDKDHLPIKDGTELCVLAALEERFFRTGLAPSSTSCQ
jgi:hypothetical protein